MKKVIFLDIDGVLNSVEYDRTRTENDGNIDLTRMPLLKKIVDETEAFIILSSSWRKLWGKGECDEIGQELNRIFSDFGLKITDKTPVIGNRNEEISSWLKEHPEVENYVILDDAFFGWGEHEKQLVKTDARIGRGLEQAHVLSAVKILNNT